MRIRDFFTTSSDDVAPTRQVNIPTHSEWLATYGTIAYSPAAAMKIPGVLRCNVLTQNLSSQIELTEQRRVVTDDGRVRWERVPSPSPIIRRPDLATPTADWTGDVATGLASQGETFLLLGSHDPVSGRATTAVVSDRDDWKITRHPTRKGYIVYTYRDMVMVPWRDFIHIRYLKLPGSLHGIGPIQAYAATLQASGKLEDWAGSLFTDGGLASLYLTTDQPMDPDEAADAQTQWVERHGDKLTPAVLSDGLKAEHAGLNPDKAQALETRMWNVQFAASAYGYNPYLLAVAMQGSSITYQTLPDLFAEAVRAVIYPDYLRKIETALSELLPRGRRARFDLTEFLRADEKTRVATGAAAVAAGLLTIDEWRAREGMPPLKESTDAPT